MAGVTDPPFRRLIRMLSKGKVGLMVSEFISTDGCAASLLKEKRAAIFFPEERPFGIQIFGRDPYRMAEAAAELSELSPDFIEINAGCPVPKVAGKGGGAGLLRELPKLRAILSAVKQRISLPVTLKCRIGWDENSINIFETLKIAEGEGAEWLTLHGRTRVQGYCGLADWDLIGEVASKSKIPVFGNGDIVSAKGACELLQKYPISGVGIGRGALHNPWIFAQIAERMESGEESKHSSSEIFDAFHAYYTFMLESGFASLSLLGRLKQLAARLSKGIFPELPGFREELLVSQTPESFLERARRFAECESAGRYFLPDRLINLNGRKQNEIIFGRQFK